MKMNTPQNSYTSAAQQIKEAFYKVWNELDTNSAVATAELQLIENNELNHN